ncbi:uncharacterized protein FOMMEDRAFT_16728 [Fomitiporia mediterranea MF3/22]|uniref:uncharacterized protein n=1 Tax=Fomitiporia mediterranea (strain MF3/22) TaxID=694068 RepID=UPI0004408601|nr:uncharacterized protein FOMMEDRAFT_16728 [Fomitiporia mediterranea MF3/22]EJD08310.1 hypothetical protein FOMMEDRAFT_16728 [Fomitiporia mediterranea MF3/22]
MTYTVGGTHQQVTSIDIDNSLSFSFHIQKSPFASNKNALMINDTVSSYGHRISLPILL